MFNSETLHFKAIPLLGTGQLQLGHLKRRKNIFFLKNKTRIQEVKPESVNLFGICLD